MHQGVGIAVEKLPEVSNLSISQQRIETSVNEVIFGPIYPCWIKLALQLQLVIY